MLTVSHDGQTTCQIMRYSAVTSLTEAFGGIDKWEADLLIHVDDKTSFSFSILCNIISAKQPKFTEMIKFSLKEVNEFRARQCEIKLD